MEDLKFTIPTNINEINLSQFVKLQEFIKTNAESNLEEFEIIERVAEIFGINKDQLNNLAMDSFYELSESIASFLLSVEKDLKSEVYTKDKHFFINEKKYLIDFKLDNMIYGQFTDVLHTLKGEYPYYLPQILAILIRPYDSKTKKIEVYNEDSLNERIELFNEKLTVRDFYPLIVFFSLFGNELQNWNMRRSLIQTMKQRMKTKRVKKPKKLKDLQ